MTFGAENRNCLWAIFDDIALGADTREATFDVVIIDGEHVNCGKSFGLMLNDAKPGAEDGICCETALEDLTLDADCLAVASDEVTFCTDDVNCCVVVVEGATFELSCCPATFDDATIDAGRRKPNGVPNATANIFADVTADCDVLLIPFTVADEPRP